jgi:hypothetical protein
MFCGRERALLGKNGTEEVGYNFKRGLEGHISRSQIFDETDRLAIATLLFY